jgi:hypothetical protein
MYPARESGMRRHGIWFALAALAVGGWFLLRAPRFDSADAQPVPAKKIDADAEIALLKAKEADQAHAMSDVSAHFSNLWFAGQKKNWPLADFYLGETKSHLRWAVRIRPIRQDADKRDIKLADILASIENAPMKDLHAAIEAKDLAKFEKGYRDTIEGCTACHKATGKPFLRPGIPTRPAETVLQFDPPEDGK